MSVFGDFKECFRQAFDTNYIGIIANVKGWAEELQESGDHPYHRH